MTTRRIATLLSALGLALGILGPGAGMADTWKQTETPHYTVERTDGAVELRDYGPRLVAEVRASGNRSQAANAGFRSLAGFIFGGNDGSANIAMTTPVAQAPLTGDGDWVVQFAMPAAYDAASLPRPADPNIRILTLPPERLAVLRFSGVAGADVLDSQTKALRQWCADQGLSVVEGPRFFFYDPPWTLPWARRNEVAFVVK